MKKSKAPLITASLVLAFWSGLVLLDGAPPKTSAPRGDVDPAVAPVLSNGPTKQAGALEAQQSKLPQTMDQVTRKAETHPTSPSAFEFERELRELSGLKAKVLLTVEEQKRHQRLLVDRGFLRGLEKLLLTPTKGDEALLDQQVIGMEHLLEALLVSQGAESAAESLKAVVLDSQIENSQLDLASREALGGHKGEILYRWSALQPEVAKDLESLLPGPASRVIWQNVQEAQRLNLAESARVISEKQKGP